MSGTGRHHGVDGFREFTNPRGVFYRGDGRPLPPTSVPPFDERQESLVQGALEAE